MSTALKSPTGLSAATRVPGTSELLAAGTGGVARRNNGVWSSEADATAGGDAVAAISSTNTWIVGPYQSSERWNGSSWTVDVQNPVNPNGEVYLTAMASLSATNVWALGYYDSGPDSYTLTEQWNGTAWNVIASANPGTLNDLQGATRVPGTSQLWAVGSYANNGNAIPLIERYC